MNTKTFILIAIIFCTIAGGIVALILMPEGRIVEYRPSYSSGGRYGNGGLQIEVVVENGLDNYIPCDALSIQQVEQMCDSLNKKIKR